MTTDDPSQRADALEEKMSGSSIISSSVAALQYAEGDMGPAPNAGALMAKPHGAAS